MSPFRKRIAERLVQSQQTAALLTTFNEVDMSAVMALRERHKQAFKERHGVSLATAKRYMLRLERGLPVRVTRTSDGRILSLLERFNRSEGNTSRRARGEQRIQ